MNKKTIIIIAIVAIVLVLTVAVVILVVNKNFGSSQVENNEQNIQNQQINNKDNNQTNEMGEENQDKDKTLVAVFSRAGENYAVGNVEVGNTQIMANYIRQYTGGDFFIIEPVTPYPSSYDETREIAMKEKNENARPQIKNKIENFDDYSTIFLGYPIWHGTYPMIINTFLESYDFTGKTIIPFNTHEGSGNSGTFEAIKTKIPTATVKDGLSIAGSSVRNSSLQVENWVRDITSKIYMNSIV